MVGKGQRSKESLTSPQFQLGPQRGNRSSTARTLSCTSSELGPGASGGGGVCSQSPSPSPLAVNPALEGWVWVEWGSLRRTLANLESCQYAKVNELFLARPGTAQARAVDKSVADHTQPAPPIHKLQAQGQRYTPRHSYRHASCISVNAHTVSTQQGHTGAVILPSRNVTCTQIGNHRDTHRLKKQTHALAHTSKLTNGQMALKTIGV